MGAEKMKAKQNLVKAARLTPEIVIRAQIALVRLFAQNREVVR